MIGIWVWRAVPAQAVTVAIAVSVPMIGIWVWRARTIDAAKALSLGFSPDDRDLGLAREGQQSRWRGDKGFSPDDRDLGLARSMAIALKSES